MGSTQPEFSREQLLKARMADLEARFIARAGADRSAILEAWRSDDVQTIRELAHRLAGVAATFGFPEIGEAAKGLDQAIDEGQHSNIEVQFRRLMLLLELASTQEKAN